MPSAVSRTPMMAADLTGRRLGRYEVLYLLASGGMATVYVSRAQGVAGFERLVAIKVLHPHLAHDEDFISMFLDEARLAARIRHPNVVATLDISDTQGDGYFLVMEYVEGDHFGNLLRNAAKGGERLPVPVVARILMDSLSGLDAAHQLTDTDGAPLDLVHRDLSPHNILVGVDGIARITDFGVAKAQVRLSSTRDGQFKGKLSYMAPEQAAAGQATQRSDLFSIGIVFWESLTGRRLFRGENNGEVLNKILNPDVPEPSKFDPKLAPFDGVTAMALAKDPDDRFSTAEEFLEAIEEAANQIGGVATPRAVGREVKRWLGEKVSAETGAIRDAIDALGRSELKPGALPRPMDGTPSSVRRTSEEMTMGAKPSTVPPAAAVPQAKRSLAGAVVGVVVGLALVGGALGAWALFGRLDGPAQGDAPPPAAVESATTTAGETTAEAPAPVETATPMEVPAEAEEVVEPPPPEESAVEETVEVTPESRRGRRRGRRHGRRRGTSSEGTGTTTAPPEDDDEFQPNPYR